VDSTVTDYSLAPALRSRVMGAALVVLGVVLGAATLVVMSTGAPLDILTGLVVLALVGIFALGYLLVRRWYVVRLDTDGYRVRFVRGAGVRAARWTDVKDVQTSTVAGARCVVLRLRDGRSTTVPVDVLEGDREQFVRTLSAHLDQGHGYRPLR
jgi:hypothetical protein